MPVKSGKRSRDFGRQHLLQSSPFSLIMHHKWKHRRHTTTYPILRVCYYFHPSERAQDSFYLLHVPLSVITLLYMIVMELGYDIHEQGQEILWLIHGWGPEQADKKGTYWCIYNEVEITTYYVTGVKGICQ